MSTVALETKDNPTIITLIKFYLVTAKILKEEWFKICNQRKSYTGVSLSDHFDFLVN